MATARHAIVEHPEERGSALIGVLLLLMMMSALVAALAVNGRTETFISRNQYSGAQAQAAAEAGLNHAVELATTYIFEWKANGFGTVGEALDALLVGPDLASGTAETDLDNMSLGARVGIDEAEAIPLFLASPRMPIAAGIVAEYEAFIVDDETAPDEDGDPLNDANERLIVRATGYGPGNTKVVLEAVISPIALPAVVTNDDLDIAGNVSIQGTMGGIHSNGDLLIDGSVTVERLATASGTWEVADHIDGSGNAAELPMPEIRASDYLIYARFILDAGTMVDVTDPPGTPPCTWADGFPCNNWNFDSSTGAWSISGSDVPANGTYYVRGDVSMSGTGTTDISIIAEGSINISGDRQLNAFAEKLLFVTDEDLELSGNVAAGPLNGGRMLVHEQVKLSGNAALFGQLIVENAANVSNLVIANAISGNVTITYNGGLGTDVYSVTGWRDVRQ